MALALIAAMAREVLAILSVAFPREMRSIGAAKVAVAAEVRRFWLSRRGGTVCPLAHQPDNSAIYAPKDTWRHCMVSF